MPAALLQVYFLFVCKLPQTQATFVFNRKLVSISVLRWNSPLNAHLFLLVNLIHVANIHFFFVFQHNKYLNPN